MKNRLSIVIPTYKRKMALVGLLRSLKGKVEKDVEIIIVEQKENNRSVFENEAKKLDLKIKYFFLSLPSMTGARNFGIKKAKGDIILFLDDDCIVETSLVGPLKEFDDSKVVAVGGRAYVKGEKVVENNSGRISFWGNFTNNFNSPNRQEIDSVIGCFMYWRKSVFSKIGLFDTKFTGNALREESDLSLRAKDAGYKIIYSPLANVLHVRADSGGARKTEGRIKWYFDFFSNETYFFLKHRPIWAVAIILLGKWEWALRCMFGFGREVSLRSFATPFIGILDGYKKYGRWKNENRS
ncbi:MAG TPA: glycosyltransferase [Patescibacteria group bacterium]